MSDLPDPKSTNKEDGEKNAGITRDRRRPPGKSDSAFWWVPLVKSLSDASSIEWRSAVGDRLVIAGPSVAVVIIIAIIALLVRH